MKKIMRDQATELRKLMFNSANKDDSTAGGPRLVVVTGGKGGVGTTTATVNLSVAMALNASRVVLVDADMYRADVAPLCGLTENGSVADVVTSRRDIHEVIQLGPAGVQIVPGLWAPGGFVELSEMRQRHLIRQWRSLRRHADIIMLDAGNGPNDALRRFWWAADDVVLVTTPDSLSVMDSYATIKAMKPNDRQTPIRLLVNQATSGDEAAQDKQAKDVYDRLAASCQRFLQTHIDWLGYIAVDQSVSQAADQGCPLVLHAPDSLPVRQIQGAAARLVRMVGSDSESDHCRAA